MRPLGSASNGPLIGNRWERGTPVNEMSEDEQAERLEELVKTFFSHPSVHVSMEAARQGAGTGSRAGLGGGG